VNKQQLDPSQIIVDLVLTWVPGMPSKPGSASVLSGNFIMSARNHRQQVVTFSFPILFEGEPFDGDEKTPPRFVLYKIAPSVWKVSPSINHPLLHAYLTLVGVPEPAPW
jgi:hypothetical protein